MLKTIFLGGLCGIAIGFYASLNYTTIIENVNRFYSPYYKIEHLISQSDFKEAGQVTEKEIERLEDKLRRYCSSKCSEMWSDPKANRLMKELLFYNLLNNILEEEIYRY